jgi:hypothetical protein
MLETKPWTFSLGRRSLDSLPVPVEDEDCRVTDGSQRVAGLDQSAAGEEFAVGTEREVAHAAIIDPLPCRVVFGEFPRVARASLRDVDCEFASSRRRSWISFGYLG